MKNIVLLISLAILMTTFASAQTIPKVDISLLDYSPAPVQPGQVMDLTLQVTNEGVSQEILSIEIVEEFPFIVEQTQDLQDAKLLQNIGFTRRLQYKIRIDEGANDGTYQLRVRYKDNPDDTSFSEKEFDIVVETFDARINVIKVEQLPKEIAPGQQGTLQLTLHNPDDKPLRNIDVVLDLTQSYDSMANMDNMIAVQAMVNARLEEISRRVASGQSPLTGATPMMNGGGMQTGNNFEFKAFAPVESSNTKNFDIIDGGEYLMLSFNIMALPNTLPGVYASPLFINYNDEENNPFHVRVDVPMTVNMDSDLFVDVVQSDLRTTDFASKTTFVVANRGLSTLQYVTVYLKENDNVTTITAPKNIYLGSLQPGESKQAEFMILAEDHDIQFELHTEYTDAFNKKHTLQKTIPYTIINRNYYRDLPYEMWLSWLILGVVILMLTIFYVYTMSKRKQ